MAQHQSIRLYGAGGLGTNIAKLYQPKQEVADSPMVAYADTSRSNLSADNDKYSYLIDGVDGSGKKRDLNAASIRKHVAPMLSEFPPGDFNLVIFSASGGTGSVFGPMLVHELMMRKKQVIAVVGGDSDSAIAIDNTLKTLRSLSALADKAQIPVTIVYEEMSLGSQRREVDSLFQKAIDAIRILTSGLNTEMDTQDLAHWLNYASVTSHEPGLGILHIHNTNDSLTDLYGALSVASLYASPDDPHGAVKAAYRTTGYTGSQGTSPLHFVITQDGLTAVVEGLERKLEEYNVHSQGLASSHVTLHDRKKSTDDFMQF